MGELTSYLDFAVEIRKIIYTTNTIENLNLGIRKYTKLKVQFPDDMAAQKSRLYGYYEHRKKMDYAGSKLGIHTP